MTEQNNVHTVDTKKYTKSGKVEVDGMLWDVKLPGANTELQMSRYQRREKFLAKKIENGTAEEADIDKYDEIEQWMLDFFTNIFKDGTPDNSEVKKWIDETPMAIIIQAFESLKEQANSND